MPALAQRLFEIETYGFTLIDEAIRASNSTVYGLSLFLALAGMR